MYSLQTMKKGLMIMSMFTFIMMSTQELWGQTELTMEVGRKIDEKDPTDVIGHGDIVKAPCSQPKSTYTIFMTMKNNYSYPMEITSMNIVMSPTNVLGNTGVYQTLPITIQPGDSYIFTMDYRYDISVPNITGVLNTSYIVKQSFKDIYKNESYNLLVITCVKGGNNGSHARIGKEETSNSVSVSPNPVKDEFKIEYVLENKSTVSIELYNSLGQRVKVIRERQIQEEGKYSMNEVLSSELNSGVYFLVTNIDGVITTERLIKSN